ncbi:hypothetical protein MJO29_005101 [Puccinia striiformis f. sp. tritici]|nr:hypothetical protein MJO29_005101 [Puccinia striiformis f. sp. tritici]
MDFASQPGDGDEHLEAARQRFRELHKTVKNAETFLGRVDPEVLAEYVEDLDKLIETLSTKANGRTATGFKSFRKIWTRLLNRTSKFQQVINACNIEMDEALQQEISKLASLLQHPTFSRHAEITHETRVVAIDAFSSDAAEEILTNLPPFDAIHERFRELHKTVEVSEAFLTKAGRPLVEKYVHDLEELKKALAIPQQPDMDGVNDGRFKSGWVRLLNRQLRFDGLTNFWFIEEHAGFQEQTSILALMLQHPKSTRLAEIPHDTRVNALNSLSIEAAQALLYPPFQPVQNKIIVEGYDHEYLKINDIMKTTLQTLAKFSTKWSPSIHLAPYTSLIAPSMTGKTRLLMELSKHACVVYICICPEGVSGHPPRSEYASRILLDSKCPNLQNQHERLLLAIFLAVTEFFCSELSETKQDIMERWIDHSLPKKDRLGDPPFWSVVEDKMNHLPASSRYAGQNARPIRNALNKIKENTSFIADTELRVLLAIDEARGLFKSGKETDSSFFRYFCCALELVPPRSTGFFSVLVDTTSRVSNFNPPELHDPSPMIGQTRQQKLFPPIYEIATFDINVKDPPTTWQQLQSPLRLLCYGFPFWRVYADDAKKQGLTKDEIVMELTQFALQKLLCTTEEEPVPAASLTTAQAFALLGSTIQPQLYGASQLNAELVASHGAQCMYIELSRQMLISEYPSQFTFSSAANQYLASDEARLIQCIRLLASARRQGHVSSGDVGELVSRIILLRAMQITMWNSKQKPRNSKHEPDQVTMPYRTGVKLVDFLQTLTGQDRDKMNLGSINSTNKNKLLDEGQLFWNHFVSIDHTPTSAGLMSQLHRGLAVNCKPNQCSFDQLFTIYLQSDLASALDEKNITFCGIKIKNRKQNNKIIVDDTHKWTPDFANIQLEKKNPYLVLYFSLKDSRTKPPTRTRSKSLPTIISIPDGTLDESESQRRASLAFYGLNAFPFLSPDLIKALEDLLLAHANILSLHEDSPEHTKKFVEVITPEVSPPETEKVESRKTPNTRLSKKRRLSSAST